MSSVLYTSDYSKYSKLLQNQFQIQQESISHTFASQVFKNASDSTTQCVSKTTNSKPNTHTKQKTGHQSKESVCNLKLDPLI